MDRNSFIFGRLWCLTRYCSTLPYGNTPFFRVYIFIYGLSSVNLVMEQRNHTQENEALPCGNVGHYRIKMSEQKYHYLLDTHCGLPIDEIVLWYEVKFISFLVNDQGVCVAILSLRYYLYPELKRIFICWLHVYSKLIISVPACPFLEQYRIPNFRYVS